MTTSTTPRTDELKRQQHGNTFAADADPFVVFARTLERELAAKDAEIARLREALDDLLGAAARVCHAQDGISVINAVALLRPKIPDIRGKLYDIDKARAALQDTTERKGG